MATQIGTTLEIGVNTIENYVVQSINDGGSDIDSEDIMDENGGRTTRIIFQVDDKVSLDMVAKDGATPETDFPEGAMCTVTGYTSFFVDSLTVESTKGAKRVRVDMTNIGLT